MTTTYQTLERNRRAAGQSSACRIRIINVRPQTNLTLMNKSALSEAIQKNHQELVAKHAKAIAEKDNVIAEKDRIITEKDRQIAARDAELAQLKAKLRVG